MTLKVAVIRIELQNSHFDSSRGRNLNDFLLYLPLIISEAKVATGILLVRESHLVNCIYDIERSALL